MQDRIRNSRTGVTSIVRQSACKSVGPSFIRACAKPFWLARFLSVPMVTSKKTPEAAHLEAAIRRHLSRTEVRQIAAKNRPLVLPCQGTKKFPNKPCINDIVRNRNLLRAIVEVYPTRVPSAHVMADAIKQLDLFFSGDLLCYEGSTAEEMYGEQCLAVAYDLKVLYQRLRRLFRRSRNSRP